MKMISKEYKNKYKVIFDQNEKMYVVNIIEENQNLKNKLNNLFKNDGCEKLKEKNNNNFKNFKLKSIKYL